MPARGFIPLSQNIHSNARVIAAARDLTGGDVDKMVGHLARLWAWALDHREDGSLVGLDAVQLATILGWPSGPREFGHLPEQVRMEILSGDLAIAEALLSVKEASRKRHAKRIQASLKRQGLITEDDRLHDWMDYAGMLLDRRLRDRERKRRERENRAKSLPPASMSNGLSADVPRDIGNPADTAVRVTSRGHDESPSAGRPLEFQAYRDRDRTATATVPPYPPLNAGGSELRSALGLGRGREVEPPNRPDCQRGGCGDVWWVHASVMPGASWTGHIGPQGYNDCLPCERGARVCPGYAATREDVRGGQAEPPDAAVAERSAPRDPEPVDEETA